MWVCRLGVLSALHLAFGFQRKTVGKGKGAAEVKTSSALLTCRCARCGAAGVLYFEDTCSLSCKAESSA